MSVVMSTKGRVLSSQQVRFSDAPIRLANQARCAPTAEQVSVITDPTTGDVTSIIIRCDCGEMITVECGYGDRN